MPADEATDRYEHAQTARDRWILSLDGGGVRGLMTAVFLERLEAEVGSPIARCFDLIAGTSSGAIVAGGVAIGPGGQPIVSASKLVRFFLTESPRIFGGRTTGVFGTIRWLRGPLYSTSNLSSSLARQAGIVRLSQIESNLLVTAYDMRRGDPVLFQSWLAGSAGSDGAHARAAGQGLMRFCPTTGKDGLDDFDLVTALSASAAVPTFFAPVRHPRQGGEHYAMVDGFVFASNPVLPAYFAARRLFGRFDRLHLLSIGTGKATSRYDWRDLKSRGALRWLRPIIEAFPDGVNDASAQYMEWMAETDDIEHIRINPSFEGLTDAPTPGFDDASPRNLEVLSSAGRRLYADNAQQIAGLIATLKDHAERRAVQRGIRTAQVPV